jgi:predicted CXXCH cytochrome family protein
MATSRSKRRLLAGFAGCLVLWAASANGQSKNSCLDCHSNLPEPLGVSQEKFSQDIHAQRGLTCASCHGGDPTSEDPDKAMSRKAGWKGKIDRKQIPQLCGTCHSDPSYIRQFNPSLRTDQLSQYGTSVHGKRLAAGDAKAAVCTDCHSVHDLRAPKDSRSTANPINVAKTCARCHGDASYMSTYKIPTNQFAEYGKSVHHVALVNGDLSAPTCTTCHGNHGAAPPGFASVANVCSTCHVFQAQLFDSSPHQAAFASAGLPGCVTCHSNHGILHPTDELLGTDDKTVCTQCHSEGDAGFVAAGKMKQQLVLLAASIDEADQVLSRAEQSGMEVSQAQLDLAQTKDILTKGRVTVHSFNLARMESDIKPGLQAAAKDYEAGTRAMAERNYRRVGLGISLAAIAFVLAGLRLYLKQIEG